MATQAPARPAATGGKAAAQMRKFRAGVQEHAEPFATLNAVPNAATPTSFTVEVPSYGFFRGFWLKFAATGGVGSVTAAVYREDAPFIWIATFQFLDVNSAPIIFQITGYDMYLIYKYGGYFFTADPKQAEEYTQGGIGGNSVFTLYVPLEIRNRDALGALPNTSANTAYKLIITVNATANVFSTAPGTLPTNAQIQLIQEAYWEPQPTDLAGRTQAQEPPSKDTTQYWSKTVFSHAASGAITDQIKRLGYLYRTMILTTRTTAPARTTTMMPDPTTLIYEGQQLTIQDRTVWRHKMARFYGYTAAVDAAGGLDAGVFVWNYNRDFGLQPGAEIGNGYMPSTSGTRIELQGTLNNAGNLDVLVNDVSAADELDITG